MIYTINGEEEKREHFINEHAIQNFSQRPNISPDLKMMMNNEKIWELEEEGLRYEIPLDYQPENYMATVQMESQDVYTYVARSGLLRRIQFRKVRGKMEFTELGFDMMIDAQQIKLQEDKQDEGISRATEEQYLLDSNYFTRPRSFVPEQTYERLRLIARKYKSAINIYGAEGEDFFNILFSVDYAVRTKSAPLMI